MWNILYSLYLRVVCDFGEYMIDRVEYYPEKRTVIRLGVSSCECSVRLRRAGRTEATSS
jgi:hypothetical protein